MRVRGMTKEDIDSVIDIINRNYDEVMIRTHSKDDIQNDKVDEITWMTMKL